MLASVSFPPARLLVFLACTGAVLSGAARTATLPANVAVTPPGGRIHGGDLAVDPRDRDRLAAVYWDERPARRGTCSIAVSSDGGGSWTSQPFAGVGSGNPLPAGATLCRAATVAFASDETLYVANEAASLSGFA